MRPKIAGIESTANSRSAPPIAIITMSIGVMKRFPSILVLVILSSTYVSVVGNRRRVSLSAPFSWNSSS